MGILPIKFIHNDDLLLVGKEIVDLSSLKRLGFPVPDGIILFPPQLPFTTVLKTFAEHDRDRFEQSLEIIRKQVFAIPLPNELEDHLKGYSVSADMVWRDCLKTWIDQIRSSVWRLGVSDDLVEQLTPIPVFFTGSHISAGNAYFDAETQKIVITVLHGTLEDEYETKLQQLIVTMRKKILLSYVVDWIVDRSGVWIVKVYPFTHDLTLIEPKEKVEIQVIKKTVETTKKIHTSLKIFADLSEGLTIAKDIDGVFIASEKVEDDDQRILKMVESALLVDEDVVFQLTDIRDLLDVSSTLRLIHQPHVLEKEIQNYLFAKHHFSKTDNTIMRRRVLDNLHLGIPQVRSVSEFEQIKNLISSLGIQLNSAHKIWIDFSVPENFFHAEDYLSKGVSGVIIHLDDLYGFLIGNQHYASHPFYSFDTSVVLDFLKPYMKILHQKKIQVLLRSEHVLDADLVKYAISEGVYGLILKPYHLAGALEYISGFERKHVMNKQVEL